MKFGRVAVAEAAGAVLAHTLRLPGGVLKKGRRLGAAVGSPGTELEFAL